MEDLEKLGKIAYVILNVLKAESATDRMSSMSVNEIQYEIRDSKYSGSTINKKLNKLVDMGLCKVGIPEGRSKTYYISKTGMSFTGDFKEDEDET